MKHKLFALVLALVMLASLFTGCGAVGEIAGNVADVAKAELEKQVRAVLNEYKVDVIELKTVAGKLNDQEGKFQFFCAVLVRSDNIAGPQSCADALGKVFQVSGLTNQTASAIESPYLVNKTLSYTYSAFDDGSTYYTIYVYTAVDPEALLNKEN